MNSKRFLNRQIFITSVVAGSPAKPAVQVRPASTASAISNSKSCTDSTSTSESADNLPPNLGTPLVLKPPASPNSLTVDQTKDFVFDSPTSPSVQEKISDIEKQSSSARASMSFSRTEKRKPESSPETTELSRKEKKIIREDERKQEKLRKKLEYKEKNTMKLTINHTI